MKPEDVRLYYKNGYWFNKHTGMSHNSLKLWLDRGFIPFKSQKKIEMLTKGELKAVWDEKEPYS